MAWFFFSFSSCDDFCCLGIKVKQTRAKNAIQFLIALTTSAVAVSVDRGCAQTELPASWAPTDRPGSAIPATATPRRARLRFHLLEQQPICCCDIARSRMQQIKDRAQ